MFGTLQSRHSLTASQQSFQPFNLSFASPFPEPELCWQVSSDSDWTPAAHSGVCPSLSSPLISSHGSGSGRASAGLMVGRVGGCWESHTTAHLTALPTICLCHKRGWGETRHAINLSGRTALALLAEQALQRFL